MQDSSKEDIMRTLVKKGCGCCLKNKKEWEKSSCKDKQELDVHYTDAIRD